MKEKKVSKWRFVLIVIGILFYLGDVGTDIQLSVQFYEDGSMTYCILTITLVALSAFTTSVFGLHLYLENRGSSNSTRLFVDSTKHRLITSIFLIVGFAPVLKSFEALYFAWKSYHCKDNYHRSQTYARTMVYEIKDRSYLLLFEAFIESAPQLVLQIYIFATTQFLNPNVFTQTEQVQCRTVFISCCSVAYSIVSYLSLQRETLDDKDELSWRLYPPIFLWRFFEVISRVLVMGLIISVHPLCLLVFIVHFSVMTLWVNSKKIDFCDNWCSRKFYDMLLAVILTFCYFNPSQRPSRLSFVVYYCLNFCENCILLGIWLHFCPSELNYRIPAVVVQLSSFFLSITFMIIYYKFFHPTVVKRRNANKITDSEEKDSFRKMADHFIHNGIEIVKYYISRKNTPEICIQNGNRTEENADSNNFNHPMQNGDAVQADANSKNNSKRPMQNSKAARKNANSKSRSKPPVQNGETAGKNDDSKNYSEHPMQNDKATGKKADSKKSSKHPVQDGKAAEGISNVKKEQNIKVVAKKCFSNNNIPEIHIQNGKKKMQISDSKNNPLILEDKIIQESTDSEDGKAGEENTNLINIIKTIMKGKDTTVKKYMPIKQMSEVHIQNGKGIKKNDSKK